MPDANATISVNEEWLAGFTGEAAKQGLDEKGAAGLLKAAGTVSMLGDQNFADGFNQEMEKQGVIGVGSVALGALLAYLASKTYGGIKKRWGRSPYETGLLQQMEEAAGTPDVGRAISEMAMGGRRRYKAQAPPGTLTFDPHLDPEEWARQRFPGRFGGGYGGGFGGGYGGGYGRRPWDDDYY